MWCEHCRDHYETDHYDADGMHQTGHEWGPTGSALADRKILDAIGGKDAVFYKNGERTWEVRQDGKHVGFIEATEQGEVIWVA